MQTDKNILVLFMDLTSTIPNKILNYRDINQVIFVMTYAEVPFKNKTLILLETGKYTVNPTHRPFKQTF